MQPVGYYRWSPLSFPRERATVRKGTIYWSPKALLCGALVFRLWLAWRVANTRRTCARASNRYIRREPKSGQCQKDKQHTNQRAREGSDLIVYKPNARLFIIFIGLRPSAIWIRIYFVWDVLMSLQCGFLRMQLLNRELYNKRLALYVQQC